MITEALAGLALGIISGLLSLFPTWTVDTGALSTTGGSVGAGASMLNGYFPVVTLGICLGILIAVKLGLLVWRGIIFVYTLIPFKMT